jgi:hypothetical protein
MVISNITHSYMVFNEIRYKNKKEDTEDATT